MQKFLNIVYYEKSNIVADTLHNANYQLIHILVSNKQDNLSKVFSNLLGNYKKRCLKVDFIEIPRIFL